MGFGSRRSVLVSLALVIALAGTALAGQGKFADKRIRFARGSDTATLRDKVSRSAAILYTVGAKAGQTMTVSIDGDAKTRFDVSGPKDADGQSMASGSTEWEGPLPDDGDYKIFVFTDDRVLAPFTLTVSIH